MPFDQTHYIKLLFGDLALRLAEVLAEKDALKALLTPEQIALLTAPPLAAKD